MPSHGIIDAGYCGELQVALFNYTNDPYEVKKYDRVAQIILHKVYNFDLALVDEFGPDYNSRGIAGFGSSGR
jgi:dUTP pyrophosphatase